MLLVERSDQLFSGLNDSKLPQGNVFAFVFNENARNQTDRLASFGAVWSYFLAV